MFKRLLISLFSALAIISFNYKCFAADTSIKVFHLPNGQTVVIKEDHASPIVTIDTWIKTGSINENSKNNGVSHFLEHLFFKGTKNHPFGVAESILEDKGAIYNAATSKDFTHFYTTIASKYAETALDLQADMLLHAAIPPEEMKKEKKVVEQEISRSLDNPHSVVFDNLVSILFKHHPYKYTTLGPVSNIENMPREEILKYYHKWYIPANMITVIVGDINTDKMLALVQNDFKNNSNKPTYIKVFYPEEPNLQKSQEIIKKGNYNSGYLLIGFKGAPAKDLKDDYALDLASAILADGTSSRLYQDIQEKQKLVSSISAGNNSMKDDGIFYINAELDPVNYTLAKKAILADIKRLRDQKVSQAELNKAKTELETERIYSEETTQSIANSIGYCMTLTGNIDCYTKYIDNIKKITAQDIQDVAEKYLQDSRTAISALLPEKSNPATSVNINKPYKPAIKSQESYKNITKYNLDNGMTLIANKNNSNDVIALSVFVKGGDLIEPIPGITDIIAGTLTKGTMTKTAFEIAEMLDKSGIVIEPSSNPDYFEIKLKSTKANFNQAFGLLVDIIKNPTFKTEYIDKDKSDIVQSFQETKDSPLSYAMVNFDREIFPNHPYGYVGEVIVNNLPKINRDNIIDFYQKNFIPDNMLVSVSGNINPAEMADRFNSAFPKKEGNVVNINNLLTSFKPLEQNELTPVTENTQAAWMVLGWPVSGIANDKEYATLKVINSILGDGLSSRLFIDLRKKQGLAYNVSSAYPSRLDNSSFFMYIGTQPEHVKIVRDDFLQEINKIKINPVSEKELSDIKQKIIGKFALAQETNLEKAHNFGWFETIGKGYKLNYEYPDLINSVTSKDIMTVANKYFSKPYAISIVAPKSSITSLESK